jgi:hypothetical protein
MSEIRIENALLLEGLSSVLPKPRKRKSAKRRSLTFFPGPHSDSMELYSHEKGLGVVIEIEGELPHQFNIDGKQLFSLSQGWAEDQILQVFIMEKAMEIRAGTGKYQLPITATDADRTHRNRKKVSESSRLKLVSLEPEEKKFDQGEDTWLFSARIPYPRHREPSE